MDIKRMVVRYLEQQEAKINRKNRDRLTNKTPTILCGNCLAGFIYHWLGLQFNSPFINLWMKNADFIAALEDLDAFLAAPVEEVVDAEENYPVGRINGLTVYFMHYPDFAAAVGAWEKRKQRIDRSNMCILFSNFGGDQEILRRFDALPFEKKVVFVDEPSAYRSACCIKGYKGYKRLMAKLRPGFIPNLFNTQNLLTGKRFIDQFDYVSFLNSIK